MAKLEDVADAELRVEEVLKEMHEAGEEEVGNDIYLHTKAVCYAILALGVRLDYIAEMVYDGLSNH